MKKILFLMILILLFGINSVSALDVKNITINEKQDSNTSWTKGYGNNFYYKNVEQAGLSNNSLYLDSTINESGYDYAYITASVNVWDNYTSSYINFDNVNIQATCTASGDITASSLEYGTITYQDGSTADIEYQSWVEYCGQFDIEDNGVNNATNNTETIQIVPSLIVSVIYSDSTRSICSPNGNTFECKLINGKSINRIDVIGINGGHSANYRYYLYRYITFSKDSSTSVITNIQTQTTQQHTDSQNTQQKIDDVKNSITDSNVNGNNSSNTISNIGGTFNTENDFLLGLLTIPYTFWTSITNVFSNSCSPLNVGTMFDKPLIFPCIELSDYLGNVFTTIIDVIFSGIIMSAFVRRIIRYYQALLSLDNSATYIGGVKVW